MYKNLKLILIILVTFLLAFFTSLLLEFAFFKNALRYSLVVLLVLVELLCGFLVLKDQVEG